MLRRLVAAVVATGALLLGTAPAYADATPPPPVECSDPGFTCDYDGTQWNVDSPATTTDPLDPNPIDRGPNVGGLIVLFMVIALVGGGVTWAWRISTARRIARDAGLDPDLAATTTILSDDGLAATYLAANLRSQRDPMDEPPVQHVEPPIRSAEDRLAELTGLHERGIITDDEYARRRTAILDSV